MWSPVRGTEQVTWSPIRHLTAGQVVVYPTDMAGYVMIVKYLTAGHVATYQTQLLQVMWSPIRYTAVGHVVTYRVPDR